jgi:hypothetical protein
MSFVLLFTKMETRRAEPFLFGGLVPVGGRRTWGECVGRCRWRMMKGVHSNMIYCKNFCKCQIYPNTTRNRNKKII